MKLKTILDSELCTGCGLCSSVYSKSISMALSEKGFLRPKVIEKSVLDIELPFCPGAGLYIEKHDSQNNILWGNINNCLVGFSSSSEVRYRGASGGVLSQIGIYLLENKLVDGVIHIGVDSNDPLKNIIKVSKTKAEIVCNAGSRYSPAAPLEKILQIIGENGNKKYAFIGKPCDVAALRVFISNNKHYANNIPYIFSFMCAGTPSIEGTYEILRKFHIKKEDLISFRYRGDGWPGVTKAVDRHFGEKKMSYNESWGNILGKYLQKRCKICPDGIGEFADIVCADAWHGDKSGYPNFEEKDGRSLIIIRTTVGVDLINQMLMSNSITTESFNINELNTIQPAQRHRRQSLFARLLAMKLMFLITPKYKGFSLFSNAMSMSFKRNIFAFCGMVLRIIRKKI
ncbi:Coenzyme F420 hydrogenase/dehydrogenase, beta subunit C-terminal domain [Escherichia coli]|uniref:Coenzyme F420 hydrogenase/dehydrogenase, beta subunit C-terminal domain n=1 Tax=Escherichia coli TaxID=562 RepID=UPI0002A20970|nr:Coenzyme F420 hydrogenase/dehydrogenase, beta subunit C-terminal domain [Escherichia coli]ELE42929.1 hypothetical protein A1U5_02433 [Escherichia coli KTE66]MED0208531.1 Coenzyme F420 hydrogenase/dehydrogenase, beta subunit C-terminal domain [Escherichia coli]